MDLDERFSADQKAVEEGTWVQPFGPSTNPEEATAEFRLAFYDCKAAQIARRDMAQRFLFALRAGGRARFDAEQEIENKVFSEHCLLEWRGVEIAGVAYACPSDRKERARAAYELLKRLPPVREALLSESQRFASYRVSRDEDAAKN